ncbi:bifunctional phosphopantothenoylcysteine decarboxylase/phosphopantothenate--cysteine ligase CoaBC [Leptothoe sp. PORK10 BA2]|uniref:bifunctional phosphopantothenoylcysteine decarboxylase/phosphopantothenate--cysteine ligase CoaBC n=1 Tax=Leptothoe sp. PORK10 BA2 TaxID=3110254 RepID=UPI002B20A5A9|nr:bifunctional phosphopantothenoylcysteine decarboxylase/phosphopantothenate--cysteine ligase CoaBC [Leptothoe sp. PORK10 BA2]MEA5463955.1 bifunctional phosphopantothenoylcysteine decarboxylase/phosphopantothenate--cysteine ligase CoaBC [Leptothoe sp. PORK10 BA2]
MADTLQAAKILVGISGGIAAYKVCEVVSTLAKAGSDVRVILTPSAEAFVSALTFATLARHAAYTDGNFWSATQARPLHIELAEWADIFLIAPLTANTLGKLAHGLGDNLLTNTILASNCPVLLAPAMNTDMWLQPSVQRNWQQILADGRYHAVGPGAGRLACDRIGTGRMAEPHTILSALASLQHTQGRQDLRGKHILISTGSTQEYIDAVRYIGNPSTGRMGIALATAAVHRGAQVSLVHGPMDSHLRQSIPDTAQTTAVVSAAELESTMMAQLYTADWIIMAAAVADLRPKVQVTGKLAKADLPNPLPLETVTDIAAKLSANKRADQTLVGFAAQTGDMVAPALGKLKRKGLNAIVANPVDQPESGFGSDLNHGLFLDQQGRQIPLLKGSKLSMAHQIYDALLSPKDYSSTKL